MYSRYPRGRRRCPCGCEGNPFATDPRPVSIGDAMAEVEAALDQHRRFPGPDATKLMAHALETVLRVPLRAAEPDPLSVECQNCGAAAGEWCLEVKYDADGHPEPEPVPPHPERAAREEGTR